MASPGPAKQFDRDVALQAGLCLFWRRGYADVSMNDLLEAMGIARQSFYNTFKSKADLFDEAVALYVAKYQSSLLAALTQSDSHHENVLTFLAQWESSAATRPNDGCFLVNTCDDFPSLRPESIEPIRTAIHVWRRALENEVRKAMKSGEVTSDLSAKRIAVILTTLGNGMMLAARDADSGFQSKGLLTDAYMNLVAA